MNNVPKEAPVRRSWKSWNVSVPHQRPSKLRAVPGDLSYYVDITCPNCGDVFESSAANVSKNKALVCLTHLKNKKCDQPIELTESEARDRSTLALPPSKRNRTSFEIHTSCRLQYETLSSKVDDLQSSVDKLNDKSQLYDHALSCVFPALELPLVTGRAEAQLRLVLPMRAPVSNFDTEPEFSNLKLEQAQRRIKMLEREKEQLMREADTFRAQIDRLKDGVELRRTEALLKRSTDTISVQEDAFGAINQILHNEDLSADGLARIKNVVATLKIEKKQIAKNATSSMF